MAENNQKKIILLIVLAFLVRLIFIYPQYSGDIKNHIAWGQSVVEQGTDNFYNRSFSGFNDANYPPLTILLFGVSYFVYQLKILSITFLNQSLSIFPSFIIPYIQTTNFEALFFKLPAILADLGIGWLLYKLTKNKIIASLYLFNPAVIYISTVWGQIESIPIFFLLLALFLIKNKKFTLSHLAFLTAILTKQTALWLTPVFLIIWFKNQTKKQFILGLFLQLLAFVLIYLPFTSPVNAITSYLATLSGSSVVVSDAAWNLWFFITSPQTQDFAPFLGLTFRLWSIILLVGVYSIISFKLFKKTDINQITLSLFLLSLVAFFIQTRVHERHLFPTLVFMLLLSIKNKNLLFLSYIALSGYHMLNLYYSLGLPFL
jgi:dolichyl-phosphate-mannose-protein mannosyltransferase